MRQTMEKFNRQRFEARLLANKAEFYGYPYDPKFWDREDVKAFPREVMERALKERPRWFAFQNLCDRLEGVDRG